MEGPGGEESAGRERLQRQREEGGKAEEFEKDSNLKRKMLTFGDTEGEHMQDFGMLNEAGNMTTKFFKNKAKKEVSKEDGEMGPNFHKTKTKE